MQLLAEEPAGPATPPDQPRQNVVISQPAAGILDSDASQTAISTVIAQQTTHFEASGFMDGSADVEVQDSRI